MAKSRLELKRYADFSKLADLLKGRWTNELGSVMIIKAVAEGQFTGHYASAVSADEDPVRGPLVGSVAGDAVGFSVNWAPQFASVTSWSGRIVHDEDDVAHIHSLWTLARQLEEPNSLWESFLSGADLFTKSVE